MAAANEMEIDERRSNPRAPIRTHVDFFAEEELQVGESVDLGGGGMLLASSLALEVGAELRLRFTPPESDRSIFMGGRVARLAGQGAFGIEFLEPETEAVEELDRLALEFIERMRGLDAAPVARSGDETHLDLRAAFAGEDELAPDPAQTEDTLYFTLTFDTKEDFLEAYIEHLSVGRVLVASPDPLDLGWPIVIEIELPGDDALLALAGEVADLSLAGEWAHEDLTVVRLIDPDSEAMERVRAFASLHQGGQDAPVPEGDSPAATVEATDDFDEIEVLVEDDDLGDGYEAEFSVDDFDGDGAPLELASEEDTLDSVISSALSSRDAGGELTWSEEQAETEREVEAAMRASTLPARPTRPVKPKATEEGRYFGDALVADLLADEGVSGGGPDFGAPPAIDARDAEASRASKRVREKRSLTDEEVERLRGDLGADDPVLRRAALQELGDAENPPADILPLLTAALDDTDSRVRWRAVRALRGMGAAAADAGEVLERHREDPDPGVRFMVVEALASLAG